jgi:5-methylcytosine-specific restriction endonuclease McrA
MLNRYGYRISERPYINRWGSVASACRQLRLFKEGKITEHELLALPEQRARKMLPLKLRWSIMQRDSFQCEKCGNRPPCMRLEVDHILPWSRGGSDDASNLQTFCDKCNAGKSSQYD